MAATITQLEARREALQAKVAKLEARLGRDEIPGTYVTGRDGVPARRHRQLDRQIERSIDQALEYKRAVEDLQSVEGKIKVIQQRPARARREDLVHRAQEELFTRINVGDLVKVGGNNPVEVARKNRKSITTSNGVRYGIYELFGIAS